MYAAEKGQVLALVAASALPRRRALAELGLPKSIYYRWLTRQAGVKLQDKQGSSRLPWNKLRGLCGVRRQQKWDTLKT